MSWSDWLSSRTGAICSSEASAALSFSLGSFSIRLASPALPCCTCTWELCTKPPSCTTRRDTRSAVCCTSVGATASVTLAPSCCTRPGAKAGALEEGSAEEDSLEEDPTAVLADGDPCSAALCLATGEPAAADGELVMGPDVPSSSTWPD